MAGESVVREVSDAGFDGGARLAGAVVGVVQVGVRSLLARCRGCPKAALRLGSNAGVWWVWRGFPAVCADVVRMRDAARRCGGQLLTSWTAALPHRASAEPRVWAGVSVGCGGHAGQRGDRVPVPRGAGHAELAAEPVGREFRAGGTTWVVQVDGTGSHDEFLVEFGGNGERVESCGFGGVLGNATCAAAPWSVWNGCCSAMWASWWLSRTATGVGRASAVAR